MPEEVGSFADEAARLADAVRHWARGEAPGRASAAVGHMATGDPACCVCPVCQVVVLLRGERPELTGRLVESVTGLVAAGQGLVETLAALAAETRAAAGNADRAGSGADAGTDRPGATGATGAEDNDGAAPRVQRIRLD